MGKVIWDFVKIVLAWCAVLSVAVALSLRGWRGPFVGVALSFYIGVIATIAAVVVFLLVRIWDIGWVWFWILVGVALASFAIFAYGLF